MVRDMHSNPKGGRTRIQTQICLNAKAHFYNWVSYAKIKFKVIKLSLKMRIISFTWLPDWSTKQHRKAQLHQLVAMATQMKFQVIFLLDRLVSIFRWHPTQKRVAPQSLSSIKTMALFPQSYPRASLLPCEHFPKACFGHALLGLLWGSISLEGPQSKRGWRNLLGSSLHQFPTQIHSSFNFVPCHQLMCSSLSSTQSHLESF